MRVLIIEDDENKSQQLQTFVRDIVPNASIAVAKSYNSGMREILAADQDLVLLDMTLPAFDIGLNDEGGHPQHYGGRLILQQMQRRSIETPVVVVTQFDVFGTGADKLTRDELDKRLKGDHPSIYLGTIYYNAAVEGWKGQLRKYLEKFQREGKKKC
jgi:CheY-like chemotaxis protein